MDNFLSIIENNFPNFIAGVVCDHHGFPIASKIPKGSNIQENELALHAIAKDRDFFNDPKLMKVKRDLNQSKRIKLCMLLEKSNKYMNRFKILNKIIETQNLF